MMQMRSDRISFERLLLGRKCRGHRSYLHFGEIHSMRAVIDSFSVGGQRISGKSLYVLMHDGSICVFVMARDRAVRYETLIRAHGMDTVRREKTATKAARWPRHPTKARPSARLRPVAEEKAVINDSITTTGKKKRR